MGSPPRVANSVSAAIVGNAAAGNPAHNAAGCNFSNRVANHSNRSANFLRATPAPRTPAFFSSRTANAIERRFLDCLFQFAQLSGCAPNLQLAHERLRPDWVLQWVRDPQKIFPGTRMPTFFPPNDKGVPVSPFPNILGGDVTAQIQAIRDHLFITVGGGRRAPRSGTVTK